MLKRVKNRICIIGMPGSGKSTIGKMLAKELNYGFSDTDKKIELDFGMKIKDIFREKGEDYFRDIETKILKKLIEQENNVISTGGGIILQNKNILKKSFNIYLYCKIEVLIERTSRNTNRPLLLDNTVKQIKDLFNKRKELYNEIADLKIITSENSEDTIKDILSYLKK
tara:strand:- start:622 stop:1128 length:507 start_codon:yes stop_codon:yes gene_type:complete